MVSKFELFFGLNDRWSLTESSQTFIFSGVLMHADLASEIIGMATKINVIRRF